MVDTLNLVDLQYLCHPRVIHHQVVGCRFFTDSIF